MRNKIIVLVLIVMGIGLTVFLFAKKPAPDSSIEIPTENKTLQSLVGQVKCSDGDGVKARLGDEKEVFWQDPATPADFIYYNKADHTVNVCLKGKLVVGKFPDEKGNLLSYEELVRVSDVSDMNQDGKVEFLLFMGQCVEGPCFGPHYILQVDGDQIKILHKLDYVRVQAVKEPGASPQMLELETICFDYDYGRAFSASYVAEFQKDGRFKRLSTRVAVKTYPEVFAKVSEDIPPKSATPQRKAYSAIQNLVFSAYAGMPQQSILKSYDELIKALPRALSEQEPEDRLSVHCKPREILKSLTD